MSYFQPQRKSYRKRELPVRFRNKEEFETRLLPTARDLEEERLFFEIQRKMIEKGEIVKITRKLEAAQQEIQDQMQKLKTKEAQMVKVITIMNNTMERNLNERKPEFEKQLEEAKRIHVLEVERLEKSKQVSEERKNITDPTKNDIEMKEKIDKFKKCPKCQMYYDKYARTPCVQVCGHNSCRECCRRDFDERSFIGCVHCDLIQPMIDPLDIDKLPICWTILGVL